MANQADVVVLGGGPAGAVASLLLASWGHSVQLITKPAAKSGLAVSLPPSCARLFDAIGVSDTIDRAGFIRSTGNTVWWGANDARVEPFAEGARGWQLEIGRLSELLLDRAIAAGVGVERRTLIDPPESFVLDCTGRTGVIARAKDVRRYDEGLRTVSLVGEWRRHGAWPVPDDTHTWIESYDDGWMWSVPAGQGLRHIAAMVDPQRSALARGGSSTDVYLAEIKKTRVFSRLIADASLQDGPRGWDATPYRATHYAGDGWLLVGDAGSFIDPLSSAGVKKALASAWLAAITAHTCLKTPSMRSPALDFFSAREAEIERSFSQESRRFLAGAAAGRSRLFWEHRAADAEDDPDDREAVQRALERLKAREDLQAVAGSAVAVEPRACVRGTEIVLEPHLVSRDDPRGVRYVNHIDVIALIELAPLARTVPDLYDLYAQRHGATALHDFLFALASALARGWLVAE